MLLSVIVPVYNAEKYLENCIKSILSQEFDDFELLLINDGSTDKSGDLCDQFAVIDRRIKVFHKENEGVSSARNLGITHALGKWTTFIDSDDSIQQNFFSTILSEDDEDLIMQGFLYFDNNILVKEYKYENACYTLDAIINKYKLYPDFSSSCAKFYKMDLIRRYHIRFSNDLTFGEDSIFVLKYLLKCVKVRISSTSQYKYRLSDTGLTNTKFNYDHDNLFYKEIAKTLKEFNNEDFYYESIEIPLTRFLGSIYHDDSLAPLTRRQILKREIQSNYRIIFKIYSNPKIKALIKLSHWFSNYFLVDYVLSKLKK